MSKNIRIHILLHGEVEGPGYITDWIKENNIIHTQTCFWKADFSLPQHEDYDMLIIMGGTPGAYEEGKYPWLKEEKKFIEKSLKEQKYILGICLGSQLLADVLGGKVYKQKQQEIGWFPIRMAAAADQTILKIFPKEFITFHWHGDTFELPAEIKNLASSELTENQAFVIDDRVVGLQFHPEVTEEALGIWCKECDTLKKEKFVQTHQEIMSNVHHTLLNHRLLRKLLDQLYENWRLKQISHVL